MNKLIACENASTTRLKVTLDADGRFVVVGSVYSVDDDFWSWKLKHNGDFSAVGEVRARDADRSFRVVRSMVNLPGTDNISFRSENERTGEVCKVDVDVAD